MRRPSRNRVTQSLLRCKLFYRQATGKAVSVPETVPTVDVRLSCLNCGQPHDRACSADSAYRSTDDFPDLHSFSGSETSREANRLQLGFSGILADETQNMNKIILADSQAIFRAGTAKVLAMDEDLRIIAQCTDLERMYHAITTFPSSIVLFAASLHPDFPRLRVLLETMGR